jgi:lipopolysaccharide biosynthesis glycosyltransferase
MTNLVLQVSIPGKKNNSGAFSYDKEIYSYSEFFAKKYAKKTNAEYYKVTSYSDYELAYGMPAAYHKLKFFDLLEKYELILFLDSDLIIKDNSPNIFTIHNNVTSVCQDRFDISKGLASNINVPYEKYFNSGMMILKSSDLVKVRPYVAEHLKLRNWEYADQGLLNFLFFKFNVETFMLDPELWNPANNCFGEYVDHYAGHHKKIWNKKIYKTIN